MAATLAKNLREDCISNLRLREVCSVSPPTPIEQVVQRMIERRTGCALVMDQGRLVGIFTERDFLGRVVVPRLDVKLPVEKVMTASPKILDHRASVYAAVELMESGGYRHIPVMGEDHQPIGVLSVKDVVHYLVEYFPANVYNLPPTHEHQRPAREGA